MSTCQPFNGRYYLEIHDSKAYEDLKIRCEYLEQEINNLRKELAEVSRKYGYESYLNNELIDICKSHGFPFRKVLDRGYNHG